MKEMLMAYDQLKKELNNAEITSKLTDAQIEQRYEQLRKMLFKMKKQKIMTVEEFHEEMLDLIEIKDDAKENVK